MKKMLVLVLSFGVVQTAYSPENNPARQRLSKEMEKPLHKRIGDAISYNTLQAVVDLAAIPGKSIHQGPILGAKKLREGKGIPFAVTTTAVGTVRGALDGLKTAGKQIAHKAHRVVQSARLIGLTKEQAAQKMINRELAKIEGKALDKNVKNEQKRTLDRQPSRFGFEDLNNRIDIVTGKKTPVDISQARDSKYYSVQKESGESFKNGDNPQYLRNAQELAAKGALKRLNVDTATMVLDRKLVKDVIKDAISTATFNLKESKDYTDSLEREKV